MTWRCLNASRNYSFWFRLAPIIWFTLTYPKRKLSSVIKKTDLTFSIVLDDKPKSQKCIKMVGDVTQAEEKIQMSARNEFSWDCQVDSQGLKRKLCKYLCSFCTLMRRSVGEVYLRDFLIASGLSRWVSNWLTFPLKFVKIESVGQ